MESLKSTSRNIVGGIFWQLLERFGAEIVTFVVSIVLARLLEPTIYGTIAIVTVFTSLMTVLVESGFSSSLIQKKNADELDFSTVFYFNVFLAICLYIGIFFLAKPIADFYELPELIWIIRILSISVILSAFKNSSKAYIAKHMQFRKYFFATLGGTISAAVVGIIMAINGYGVWALVCQYLTNALIDAIILFFSVKWKPQLRFSFKRLKGLFSFGWKLLCSSLVDTISDNLRSLVIGKKYTKQDLAFFNRGQSFPHIIGSNVTSSLLAVLFPAFANIQDEEDKLKEILRKSVRISSYLIMPMMIGLAVVAEPLVLFILGEKWLMCVPYLQLFCIYYSCKCIASPAASILKGTGRSGVLSLIQIVSKIIDIAILLVSMWFGIIYIAIFSVVSFFIHASIYSWAMKKYYNYSFKEQFRDLCPNILVCVMMGVFVFCLKDVVPGLPYVNLAIQVVVGIAIYFAWSFILSDKSFLDLVTIIKSRQKKNRGIKR